MEQAASWQSSSQWLDASKLDWQYTYIWLPACPLFSPRALPWQIGAVFGGFPSIRKLYRPWRCRHRPVGGWAEGRTRWRTTRGRGTTETNTMHCNVDQNVYEVLKKISPLGPHFHPAWRRRLTLGQSFPIEGDNQHSSTWNKQHYLLIGCDIFKI